MTVLSVLLMGGALALAQMLRLPLRSASVAHIAVFLVSIGVAAGLIRAGANALGIERRSDFDSFVAYNVGNVADSNAPLIVFVGASYTRNAIDAEALTDRLGTRGVDAQVVTLALEGASLQERRTHLMDFLARSPRQPDMIFLEVAPEFDADPAYVFQIAKFSDRAIDQFTPGATMATAQSLMARHCGGLVACAKSAAFTGAHSLMNALNIGLLFSGETWDEVEPRNSFDPQTVAREQVSAEARADGLSARLETAPTPLWGQGYRAEMIGELEDRGIRVGLYFPPVIDPAKRAYGRGLCDITDGIDGCVIADDPALLSALDGDHWFDPGHLLVSGADIYMDWLADRLTEAAL